MSDKIGVSDGRRTKTCLLSWGSLYITVGSKSIMQMMLMMGKAHNKNYKA
jgi:hypothetical protein